MVKRDELPLKMHDLTLIDVQQIYLYLTATGKDSMEVTAHSTLSQRIGINSNLMKEGTV